ncbi:MAG: hypothetical protein H8E30_10335, partial [Alphaproteobacteria bacterium]|nr:hypothetical protein [Alphaproteobacteria bacterium]
AAEGWAAALSLKGVALGIGAWAIAALAEAAEGCRDSPPAIRRDAVVEMRAALERVRCFVAALN